MSWIEAFTEAEKLNKEASRLKELAFSEWEAESGMVPGETIVHFNAGRRSGFFVYVSPFKKWFRPGSRWIYAKKIRKDGTALYSVSNGLDRWRVLDGFRWDLAKSCIVNGNGEPCQLSDLEADH